MIDIKNCPSLLTEGFDTYSPKAIRLLFDGKKVSHKLDFNIDEFRSSGDIVDAMHRISKYTYAYMPLDCTYCILAHIRKLRYYNLI